MLVDLLRGRNALRRAGARAGLGAGLLVDDLAAQLHAFIADIYRARTGDQALDLVLVLPTERAVVLDPSGSV
jgi:hypothetical protein